MYFTKQNIFNINLQRLIPKNMSFIELNNWLYNQPSDLILKINNVMKDNLKINGEYIKDISDFINKISEIRENKYISELDIDIIENYITSFNISPIEEAIIINGCFNVNKAHIKQNFNYSSNLFSLMEDKSSSKVIDEFDLILEKIEKDSKLSIEKSGRIDESEDKQIFSMESLEKTITIFNEFYKNTFNFNLKSHQKRVIRWLIERRYTGMVCADTGIGKTLIGIAVGEFLYEVGAITKIIIISPLSSIKVWKDEIEKHLKENLSPDKYFFLNYEKLLSRELTQTENSLVILDEAHRLKGEFSKVSDVFKKLFFKYKISLSATIVDRIEELTHISDIMNLPSPFNKDETINSVIAKKIMCNISASSIGIRKATEINVGLDFENNLYEEHESKLDLEYNHITKLNKLKEFCSYNNYESKIVQVANANKLKNLFALINKHGKDQIIIFTNFVQTSEYLENILKKKYKVSLINGGIKDKNRDEIIDSFKNNETQIMVATQKVLGISQNFQNANVIIFYDNDWSCLNKIQAKGRILRLNQTKQCFIYNLFYKNSIEQYILETLEKKENSFNNLMNIINID